MFNLRNRRRKAVSPDGAPRKPRILYFIVSYPTFSETYMHEEMRSLQEDYDIFVVTYKASPSPRRESFPHVVIPYRDPCLVYGNIERVDVEFRSKSQRAFLKQIDKVIEDFQPDILHGHYFGIALLLKQLSERHGIPFTIRTHSMDVLSEPTAKLAAMCEAANSERCERVLTYPANRDRLIHHGIDPAKVVDCWPVVNVGRFFREEPHEPTGRIMCAGPCIPKKAHHEFIDLAARMRDSGLSFDLYADGPAIEQIRAHNASLGDPVTITYADPDDMPDVYHRYDWLVYPSDQEINKVGLPVAIAEAQASGIGVCWQELPGRRQEQLDFLGGGGVLFRSIEDVPSIISQPYSDEMRRAGLRAAARCDIEQTKHLLTDGWERLLADVAA